MNDQANKIVDDFVDKVMKSSTLESPPFNFTDKVMAHVTATSKSTVTVYKPLISKTTWGILLLVTIGMIVYSIFSKDNANFGWFNLLDLSKVTNLFSGIKISTTVMYSLIMFAVMLFIQVPLLKHYFNKRFEV